MSVNLPAFPSLSLLQDRDGCYSLSQEGGVTKRELFAAMMMQGLMASDMDGLWPTFAHGAVQAADALLAELEKDSP